MGRLRFGVIGCGRIATATMIPRLRASERAELVAVASRRADTAAALAAEHGVAGVVGYATLLDRADLDAVYIATPIGLHAEWAIAAAARGLHVLCEKSLAGSLAEVERILAAADRAGVALMEGFAYRFHPNHAVVAAELAAGTIGEPRQVRACFGFPPISSAHRYDPDLGGGALNDAGAYCVHAARMLFGREPVAVHGTLHRGEHAVDVQGAALLDFGEGCTAVLGFGFDNGYRNSYEIWGSAGVMGLDRTFSIPPTLAAPLRIQTQGALDERALPPGDHFAAQIEAFCLGVADLSTIQEWRADALGQARVMEAIRTP